MLRGFFRLFWKYKVLLIPIFIFVSAYMALSGYRYYQYVEHNPSFCGSCHIMKHAEETWKESVHKDVNCKSCHVQDVSARARILWSSWTKNTDSVGKHTKLDREICQKCHYSGDKNMRQVADTIGHKQHIGKLDLQCLSCHVSTSENLHVFTPSPKNCQTCHSHSTTNAGNMKDMHCTTCHTFLSHENAQLTPKTDTCLSCHSGMQVKDEVFPDDNPMPFDCADCHKPHTKTYLTSFDCLTCHVDLFDNKNHTNLGQVGMTGCVTCHRPHDWKPRPGTGFTKADPRP